MLTTSPSQAEIDFDALANCESSNQNANTGNGYYGYYQFDLKTWASTGRSGVPSDYSKQEQTQAAKELATRRKLSPWPNCAGRHIHKATVAPVATPVESKKLEFTG
jgi:hypothetical protein